MELCDKHTAQLQAGFEREGIAQFKAATPEEMEHKLQAGPEINPRSFEPFIASVMMMLAGLSEYYGLPVEAIPHTHSSCPACQIYDLGSTEVIEECVQQCKEKAIAVGLIKPN